MKITVMTSDEQILNLDVDPNESVCNPQKSFILILFIIFLIADFHATLFCDIGGKRQGIT